MDREARPLRQLRLTVLGVALAAAIALLIAAPRTASAFIGESQVLNPTKTDLTGPAKTILTNPTFLEETFEAGGASARSGLLRSMMGSGLLPWASKVLPMGAAAFLGYEVCNAFISEGCFLFGKGDNTQSESTGGWTECVKLGCGGTYDWSTIKGVYPAAQTSESHTGTYSVVPGNYYSTVHTRAEDNPPCSSGSFPAAGLQGTRHPVNTTTLNCAGLGYMPLGQSYWTRQIEGWNGRAVTATIDTGTSNYSGAGYCAYGKSCAETPNSGWSSVFADNLTKPQGMTKEEADIIGQWVASQIPESGVASPFAVTVTVPSCSGESWIGCKEILEELELVPERSTLTWSEAHLDLAPDEVFELAPAPGTELETGSKVVVTTNPGEAGMPIIVPAPEEGETYGEYSARLNPALSPERHDLEAAYVDPAVGPNGVVSVQPQPETRLDPSKSHEVKVTTNPADAPAPAPAWSPPGIPAINMTPLTGLGSPCSVFPFGLLCWLGEGLAQFNTAGVCPHAAVPVNEDADFELTLCGETSDQVMGYVRPALLLVFIVGCGFLFARATKAVGGD